MHSIQAHVKEGGAGPTVICLHANASHGGQWRGLMNQLSAHYRVIAADSYGAGQSPEWYSEHTITLQDEVELLRPVIENAGEHFSLVGHSYGGAVALKVALMYPDRVKALALFEPTFFSVVEQEGPAPNDVDGIRNAVSAAAGALDAGDAYLAAQHFIDFWMGAGSWARTPEDRKPTIAASVRNVRRWGHALFTEPTKVSDFKQLRVPVCYMLGGQSQWSAHAVAKRLLAVLPQVEPLQFPDLGHMGPVTNPNVVNAAIAEFLGRFNPPV